MQLGKFPFPGTTGGPRGQICSTAQATASSGPRTFPREETLYLIQGGGKYRTESRIRRAFLERFEVEPEKRVNMKT